MKQQRLLSLLTILIVLYIQYSSVVHAAEHQFHVQDESCEVFISAERLADATLQNFVSTLVTPQLPIFHTVFQQNLCEQEKHIPRARSPPVFFT